jgi:hypothetical protein
MQSPRLHLTLPMKQPACQDGVVMDRAALFVPTTGSSGRSTGADCPFFGRHVPRDWAYRQCADDMLNEEIAVDLNGKPLAAAA